VSIVVFLGPTLPHAEARRALDADYRAPAAHGDVLRAALARPQAIALVDGVFERVPSVWHKEILFALSEGVPVYGAASMGALRAAELGSFGMRGVGAVYRAYADGVLEDDDEVAVAHADGEHGWRPTSDALVDVRATLDAALRAGVVPGAAAARVVERLRATFYPDRLLLRALDPADGAERRLLDWLPGNRVERKRQDALELLRRLSDGVEPVRTDWTLQRTRVWEAARQRIDERPMIGA
jgi:hypothetical protein